MITLPPAPPRQRACSATAERENYQAIFLEENSRTPMQTLSAAPPRQPAGSATAERETYQAIFLEENNRGPMRLLPLPLGSPLARPQPSGRATRPLILKPYQSVVQ